MGGKTTHAETALASKGHALPRAAAGGGCGGGSVVLLVRYAHLAEQTVVTTPEAERGVVGTITKAYGYEGHRRFVLDDGSGGGGSGGLPS
jgi:hypothetical protein